MRVQHIRFEPLEQRTLLAVTTGSIVGSVFVDANENGVRDAGEQLDFVSTHIYLDINRNNRRDSGERAVRLSQEGHYRIDDVDAGTYHVSIENYAGYRISEPSGGYNVTVFGGKTRRRIFAVAAGGEIRGHIFIDANRNGVRDPGEIDPTVQQKIYLDLNNNGIFDSEPLDSTFSGHQFLFDAVPVGHYTLRIKSRGQTFTTPRAFSLTIVQGGTVRKNIGLAP